MVDIIGRGWGTLGIMGLRNNPQLLIKCKFIAHVLGVYCLMQSPESKTEQQIVSGLKIIIIFS